MNKCMRKCLLKNLPWTIVAALLAFAVGTATTLVLGAVLAGVVLTIGTLALIQQCRAQCKIG